MLLEGQTAGTGASERPVESSTTVGGIASSPEGVWLSPCDRWSWSSFALLIDRGLGTAAFEVAGLSRWRRLSTYTYLLYLSLSLSLYIYI